MRLYAKLRLTFLLLVVDGYINERECNVHNTIVDCSRLALTSIPRHLPTYVTSLDFSGNKITAVRAFTFQDFQNVTELHLEINRIQSIDKMAFHGLHRLQQLHLGVNSLTMLSSGVFDNLNYLEYLLIDNNKLKDYQADQIKELSTLLSLRTLSFDIYPNFQFPVQWSTFSDDLPRNPIDQIFRSFDVLKERNMTNVEIAYSRFSNKFNLDFNKMKYLWPICLKRLTLHDLYITSIDLYAFEKFSVASKCLEYLEVSENIILGQGLTLFGYIQNFEKLKVLKLLDNTRNNRLKRSEPKNLNVILPRTLEELYIENDIHDHLCNVIFNNSLNLRVLSLKDNPIKSCKGSFKGALNVEYFDMSGWTCTQVSVNLLYGFPNLRTPLLGKGFKNTANAGSF
ncbi:SLIT3 [Mytilus edulis]|uniref:SLIT3 n=1 Tax=Mytilus edulis TaxID=6550 RepID=A0A8S3Q4P9_MYTED|nr:SLIT3 [Mytilus edulis]